MKMAGLRRAKLLVPAVRLLHAHFLCHFAEFGSEQSSVCSPKASPIVFRTLFRFLHALGLFAMRKSEFMIHRTY